MNINFNNKSYKLVKEDDSYYYCILEQHEKYLQKIKKEKVEVKSKYFRFYLFGVEFIISFRKKIKKDVKNNTESKRLNS